MLNNLIREIRNGPKIIKNLHKRETFLQVVELPRLFHYKKISMMLAMTTNRIVRAKRLKTGTDIQFLNQPLKIPSILQKMLVAAI